MTIDNKNTQYRSEGDINLTPAREEWNAAIQDAETQEILKRDEDVYLHQAMSTPCLDSLVSAQGIYIEDHRGKKYMDFHGNNVHQVGYGHPEVKQAIIEQMDALPFSPRRFTNETSIKLAEKLTTLAGGDLDRVLFTPAGTSAVGMALKLARFVTGNQKVVSLWDAFHGANLDAIGVGGEAVFRHGMGAVGGMRIPPADSYRGALHSPDGSDVHYADYLEYVIEKEGGVGAFIAEAVRNTDVKIPSKAYWQRVREICDKHNVLLIIDDIPNGLGRTGEFFTHLNFDFIPDVVCIGKGLGGGIVPLAAMITKNKYNVAEAISMGHYTHEKSPVCSAAALAMINVLERDSIMMKVKDDAKHIKTRLEAMKEQYPIIGDVRGMGLLWGVELVKDHDTKDRAFDEAEAVLYECLNNGLSFKLSQGNVVQLCPPLIIERAQLDDALDILETSIANLTK